LANSAFNLEGVEKLLILRLGRLGDLLMASWLIHALKAQRPDLRVELLTSPACRPLLKTNPDFGRVHYYRRWLPFESWAWIRWKGFGALVDLNDSPSRTTGALVKCSGVGRNAGFKFGKHPGAYAAEIEAPPPDSSHILQRLAAMARALGVDTARHPLRPYLVLDPRAWREVQAHLCSARQRQGPLAAFNLSAGRASRLWNPDGWRDLCARLLAAYPQMEILALAAPAEQGLARALARENPGRVLTARHFGFQHFAAYIREAGLLVSPDTSAVHIASAFERPVLGLYPQAAWNLVSWRPMGTRHEVVVSRAEDRGDFNGDEVFQKAEILLKEIV
jgi:ADP-heptose:LPS heptosyltransferase